MTEIPERVSKRTVSHTGGHDMVLPLHEADLRELDLNTGDTVKVVAYSDHIEIRLEDDNDD